MIFALLTSVLFGSASAACPASNKCYHGGLLEYPETNAANFPRCWFKEAGGHWGCYNPLNDSCCDINGRDMVDITSCKGSAQPSQPTQLAQPSQPAQPIQPIQAEKPSSDVCGANLCYHGGETKYPERDQAKFPRCWFKEAEGHWGCYNPLNNSCSNINGRNMIDRTSCKGSAQPSQPTQPAQPVQPIQAEKPSSDVCGANLCYHGGETRYPERDQAKFPRCWFKEAEGHWGCYNPLNNSCSNINGRNMIDRTSCKGSAQPSQPTQLAQPIQPIQAEKPSSDVCGANLCYHGGETRYPERDQAKFPRCWFKEAEGHWGCYNPLNNSCSNINGRNMIDIHSCQGKGKVQSQPPKCPDLAKDSCQVNFDPSNTKASDQPQFWVYSNGVWGCSDDSNAIARHGQVIDLVNPPAECRMNNESMYACE
ncbi:hypothetical protein DSO57_1021753 [Entomophthora muscae]|uniref:Uncharacterized protein n=1 Tax=Entomophthora muscae TaxID=34485 RepID=A0ACC2S5W3_9FUNG|nr:hypothetical protein DSO57_1021753 [Entomophthora muscae]